MYNIQYTLRVKHSSRKGWCLERLACPARTAASVNNSQQGSAAPKHAPSQCLSPIRIGALWPRRPAPAACRPPASARKMQGFACLLAAPTDTVRRPMAAVPPCDKDAPCEYWICSSGKPLERAVDTALMSTGLAVSWRLPSVGGRRGLVPSRLVPSHVPSVPQALCPFPAVPLRFSSLHVFPRHVPRRPPTEGRGRGRLRCPPSADSHHPLCQETRYVVIFSSYVTL